MRLISTRIFFFYRYVVITVNWVQKGQSIRYFALQLVFHQPQASNSHTAWAGVIDNIHQIVKHTKSYAQTQQNVASLDFNGFSS